MNNIVSKFPRPPITKDQVEERIRGLQTQLADAHELLNTFAPIARLQDEILSEIFQATITNDHYNVDFMHPFLDPDFSRIYTTRCRKLLRLTSISRRWKRVAFSTAGLWSTVNTAANVSESWLQRVLTNSKSANLTVQVFSLDKVSLLRMITPHVPRIKSFRFRTSEYHELGVRSFTGQEWKDLGWILPSSLEELELWGIDFNKDLFADNLPSHRRLILYSCPHISWKDIIPSRLTSFMLIEPGNRISIQAFCNILRAAPSLSILIVDKAIKYVPTEPVNVPPPIIMKEATLVRIMDSGLQTISQFLLRIKIPTKAKLDIDYDPLEDRTELTPSEIMEFLERSVCAPHGTIHKIDNIFLNQYQFTCHYNGSISTELAIDDDLILDTLARMDLDHLTTLSFLLLEEEVELIREIFAKLPNLHEMIIAFYSSEPLCCMRGWEELLSPKLFPLRKNGVAVPPFRSLRRLKIINFMEENLEGYIDNRALSYATIRPTELIDACATWVGFADTHGFSKFDVVFGRGYICEETVRELKDVGQTVVLEGGSEAVPFLHLVSEFWSRLYD